MQIVTKWFISIDYDKVILYITIKPIGLFIYANNAIFLSPYAWPDWVLLSFSNKASSTVKDSLLV
jgi:hypothetical protein